MQNWMVILIRSISLFFIVMVLVRLMGKRNIARMRPFHVVNYLIIAVITAMISTNIIINPALGFVALGVWILLPITMEYAAVKSKWAHDLIYGKEMVLIKHGKIMEENLLKTRLTGEELLADLRSKNAFNLADVEFAVMESTGDINVFLKSDKKPMTAHDMGIKVAPQTEPQTVILDGNVLHEPLASLGLTRQWLDTQLQGMGISIHNVFLGQVDSSGDLYIDLFDDVMQKPQPKVKEMLYANLEKCQADLMNYSLQTQDEKAKSMYAEDAQKLKQLMDKLQPYLLR